MADVIHPSLLQLEQLATELPWPGDAERRAHVAACADCTARWRCIVANRDAFLVRNPPHARASAIAALRTPPPRRWLAAGFALAAAAAVVGWLATRGRAVPALASAPADAGLYVAAKGARGPRVVVRIRSAAGGAARLLGAAPVVPGDTVELELDPGVYVWAAIVEVDEMGASRVLDELVAPASGGARAYVVDDTPVPAERLAVVYAEHALTASELASVIHGAPRAPGGSAWVERVDIAKTKAPVPAGSSVGRP